MVVPREAEASSSGGEIAMKTVTRIDCKRLIESGCRSRSELVERLTFWAARYRFKRTAYVGDHLTYARGSYWRALFQDLRRLPITVNITVLDDELGQCSCTASCTFWLGLFIPDDEERLSEQMDLLEACLKGAIGVKRVPAEPGTTPHWGTQIASEEIQEKKRPES
jgi:hypothetical protein